MKQLQKYNQIKALIMALFLTSMFFINDTQAQCYTSSLELSTGWNGNAIPETNYTIGTNDNFWASNSGSYNNSAPTCSKVLGTIDNVLYNCSGTNVNNTKSRMIALNNLTSTNLPPSAGPCINNSCSSLFGNNGDKIVYKRAFKVGTNNLGVGTTTLKFAVTGDFRITNASLTGLFPVATYFTYSPITTRQLGKGCLCSTDPQQCITFNNSLSNITPYINAYQILYLEIELENEADSYPLCVSNGGKTDSWLQVEASISSTVPNAFLTNQSFGMKDFCGAYYPLDYDYSLSGFIHYVSIYDNVACDAPNFTSNINITNGTTPITTIPTGVTYSYTAPTGCTATFAPNAANNSTVVTMNGAGTYTMFANYRGCQKQIGVYTLYTPTISVSPTFTCVPNGSTATITATGNAPISPNPNFKYKLTGVINSPYGALQSGAKTYSITPAAQTGTYTVDAIDENGCIAIPKTFKVGSTFATQLFSLTPCLPAIAGGTLTLTASPWPTPVSSPTYSLSIPTTPVTSTVNTSGSFVISTAGTYTLSAKDAVGCTGTTTTLLIKNTNALTLNVTPNCITNNSSFSVTGNNTLLNSSYIINGPSGSGATFTALIFPTTGTTANLQAIPGIYTVTASSGGNSICSALTQTFSMGSCGPCALYPSINYQDVAVNTGSPSNTSSAIWPSGTVPSTPIHILNNITINSNCTIANNANVLIDPGVTITILDGSSLTINNSTLYGCKTMWSGITVGTSTGTAVAALKITNSTIQDMELGIYYEDGRHTLEATNSIFKNNGNRPLS